MNRQLDVFEGIPVIGDTIEERVTYKPIKSSRATFLSGTKKEVHQWFRLTPSFGPDLVDIMLQHMEFKKGDVVLDPFCGASTTLIQCKLKGVESFGFEINPLLYFVGKTCINWELDEKIAYECYSQIVAKYTYESELRKNASLEETNLKIPTIHNVHRWWRSDVLKELLILKYAINSLSNEQKYKDFFLLGLTAVLVPDLTNVTLGKLQLHFIDRSDHDINVIETFSRHVRKVLSDLDVLNDLRNQPYSRLYHTDATDIQFEVDKKAQLVITSPPYPNRYSYVWNTRPHLFFLDIFDNAKQASALDLKTIGGTWGTATSILQKGIIEPEYECLRDILLPTIDAIREKDNLMANYVIKYFNLIAKQIVEMEKVIDKKVKVGYVVGNSEIKGVYVATDIILGKIFESLNLGYKITEIVRFRKRNSGVNLYESIVYAEKP